jgi:hypothetical protein
MCGYWVQDYPVVVSEIKTGLFLRDVQVFAEGA